MGSFGFHQRDPHRTCEIVRIAYVFVLIVMAEVEPPGVTRLFASSAKQALQYVEAKTGNVHKGLEAAASALATAAPAKCPSLNKATKMLRRLHAAEGLDRHSTTSGEAQWLQ